MEDRLPNISCPSSSWGQTSAGWQEPGSSAALLPCRSPLPSAGSTARCRTARGATRNAGGGAQWLPSGDCNVFLVGIESAVVQSLPHRSSERRKVIQEKSSTLISPKRSPPVSLAWAAKHALHPCTGSNLHCDRNQGTPLDLRSDLDISCFEVTNTPATTSLVYLNLYINYMFYIAFSRVCLSIDPFQPKEVPPSPEKKKKKRSGSPRIGSSDSHSSKTTCTCLRRATAPRHVTGAVGDDGHDWVDPKMNRLDYGRSTYPGERGSGC